MTPNHRSEFALRRAIPGDEVSLASILRSSFRPFRDRYTTRAYRATVSSREALARRIDRDPIWIAHDQEGTAIGTISAIDRPDGTYIRSMAVVPRAQGRALGRQLLATVRTHAMSRGSERIYLSTTPFLEAAIRLYEAAGFLRTAAGPFELHGTPLFTMELRLPVPAGPAAPTSAGPVPAPGPGRSDQHP